jgi:hypothetical protein
VRTFEQLDFGFQPSIDERQIRELRSLRFKKLSIKRQPQVIWGAFDFARLREPERDAGRVNRSFLWRDRGWRRPRRTRWTGIRRSALHDLRREQGDPASGRRLRSSIQR